MQSKRKEEFCAGCKATIGEDEFRVLVDGSQTTWHIRCFYNHYEYVGSELVERKISKNR